MWGGISSGAPADLIPLFARLVDPSLANDDRGGRDVLYPLPEPAPVPVLPPLGWLLLCGVLALSGFCRLRR